MGLEHSYRIRHFAAEGEQSSSLSAILFDYEFDKDFCGPAPFGAKTCAVGQTIG
jgi:hypothetical protein